MSPPFPLLNCTIYQADTQEMPNVDDYIAQKAAVYRLQQDMTNWERKVNSRVFKIGDFHLAIQKVIGCALANTLFSKPGHCTLYSAVSGAVSILHPHPASYLLHLVKIRRALYGSPPSPRFESITHKRFHWPLRYLRLRRTLNVHGIG